MSHDPPSHIWSDLIKNQVKSVGEILLYGYLVIVTMIHYDAGKFSEKQAGGRVKIHNHLDQYPLAH